MWSYWYGCCRMQSSRTCSSSSVNHGLSRQLASTTTAPVGFSVPRSMKSTASVLRLAFQLNHNSEPEARIVGRSRVKLVEDSVCASSHHARLKPSSDLIDSAV